MAKMTLEELRKLREGKKREMASRETAGKDIKIIIGMGTCGIAAGAKATFDELVKEIDAAKLSARVSITQTGCMGLCYVEPTLEVRVPGMPDVIYGKLTADVAKELVEKHLVGGKLLDNHIYDRPAADIVKK
jgi:NADP-reducing hydrogenase subunit HndB